MAAPFTLGPVESLILQDGEGGLPAGVLFANASPAEREAALGQRLQPDGRVLAPYNCLLVRTSGRVVLVDTGIGPYEHPLGGSGGRLEQELVVAGSSPDEVDVVVLTHGHLDHIGGLCNGGRPRFPRARHLISRTEWELWTDESRLAQMPPLPATVAREQLPPLERAGLIELVNGSAEVVTGVRLVAAPGHSPGQLVVELVDEALYLADVVIDELHVEHPDWVMAFEPDPNLVTETRRRLLGRAADEMLSVAAAHLAAPARVRPAGAGFGLDPFAPTA